MKSAAASNRTLTVLIVDDEADILELLELTLIRMGLESQRAMKVAEAIELLQSNQYDLCLTDMRLSDGTGIEIVKYIGQHYPELPVAVITAYGSTENAVAALKAGPSIQVKLLRVLEDRHVLRVGGREPVAIDVRFVSATNRDLEADLERGTFRRDLYFRLNGFALTIPPLRARVLEIEPLARLFAAHACRLVGRAAPLQLSREALALLSAHGWPGNVRELRNVIERAVVLCEGDTLLPEHLPPKLVAGPPVGRGAPRAAQPEPDPMERLLTQMAALERQRIVEALDRCGGNQTQAAELLGISRRTFVTRLATYDLQRRRRRPEE